ncbi:hypothetical protein MNBD_NITROSPIRAE02-232, partial [hydrothermal vent metagenome]
MKRARRITQLLIILTTVVFLQYPPQ